MDWRVPLADIDFGLDEEQAVLDPGGVRVERMRRRPGNDLAVNIKMAVVAGADVLALIRLPVHTAAEMGANIGKGHHFCLRFAVYENAVAIDCLFPAIGLGARKWG